MSSACAHRRAVAKVARGSRFMAAAKEPTCRLDALAGALRTLPRAGKPRKSHKDAATETKRTLWKELSEVNGSRYCLSGVDGDHHGSSLKTISLR